MDTDILEQLAKVGDVGKFKVGPRIVTPQRPILIPNEAAVK